MTPKSERHADLLLAPTPETPAGARDFLAATCREWDVPRLVEPGELAVSELVTNAVRHAGTPILVGLRLTDGALTISVHDEGDGEPHIVPPDERLLGGRGLVMVAKLAEAWGVDAAPDGKSVWCRLRASAED